MEFNKDEEYKLSLLKSMPKHQLQIQQHEKILNQLQIAARENKSGSGFNTLFRRLSISIAFCLVMFIPFLLFVTHKTSDPNHSSHPIKKEKWEVSPTFDRMDWNGSIVSKKDIRGIKGKIGFLDTQFVAKDPRAGSKMFWYVWGNPDQLLFKDLKATATYEETGEKFTLNETKLEGPVYGEDASALTSFNPFPKKGLWKIDVSIDAHHYGSIIVKVKAPYIATKKSQFYLSKDDVKVGLSSDINFEVKGERKESIINILATYMGEKNHILSFPYTRDNAFNYSNGDTFTGYSGKLKLDRAGKWKITVLGESTIVTVKK
jgi:hypothetical protein